PRSSTPSFPSKSSSASFTYSAATFPRCSGLVRNSARVRSAAASSPRDSSAPYASAIVACMRPAHSFPPRSPATAVATSSAPRVRVMINVLSAAVVLRLLRIDDLSLWADEGVTWWNATHGTWGDAVFAESNHPPVWWLVTRAWVGHHPHGEAALRMPAAILGA